MPGGEADDDVAQLAHIARESVIKPKRFGVWRSRQRAGTVPGWRKPAEMIEQQQAVVAHFAQRRDADVNTDRRW
jgi:hypothetical protein